jgi:hypothetical protein
MNSNILGIEPFGFLTIPETHYSCTIKRWNLLFIGVRKAACLKPGCFAALYATIDMESVEPV